MKNQKKMARSLADETEVNNKWMNQTASHQTSAKMENRLKKQRGGIETKFVWKLNHNSVDREVFERAIVTTHQNYCRTRVKQVQQKSQRKIVSTEFDVRAKKMLVLCHMGAVLVCLL